MAHPLTVSLSLSLWSIWEKHKYLPLDPFWGTFVLHIGSSHGFTLLPDQEWSGDQCEQGKMGRLQLLWGHTTVKDR